MYACICKQITDREYRENLESRKVCGTGCGKCLEWINSNLIPGTAFALIPKSLISLSEAKTGKNSYDSDGDFFIKE